MLVIDDPSERLLAGEELLAALGYEPVGFTRADDALAACRVAPKRFDALLVGHVGSAGPALELADAMHAILPDTPIVLAAASADEVGMKHWWAPVFPRWCTGPLSPPSSHRLWRAA